MSLLKAFRAGFVRRWHTNPDLAHTNDRIDAHSGRVARIILMMHPDPSVALLRAALIHDDGESVVGDIPAIFKNSMGKTDRASFEAYEDDAVCSIWPKATPAIADTEIRWLKFADRLDAYMWASHHAAHIMDGDGWPDAWAWLELQSNILNCVSGFRDAVRDVRRAA